MFKINTNLSIDTEDKQNERLMKLGAHLGHIRIDTFKVNEMKNYGRRSALTSFALSVHSL